MCIAGAKPTSSFGTSSATLAGLSKVFAVAWDQQHLDRTQRLLQAWTTGNPAAAKTEAAGLRQAIADDCDTFKRHGALHALKKINQLKQATPEPMGLEMIDDFRLWGSKRCRRINAPPNKT